MRSSLRLRPVDELVALPSYRNLHRLLRRRVTRGRHQLLPAIGKRASAWCPGSIGPKAGSFEPAWWEPDPMIPCSAVHLFRMRGAYYIPSYGVVISSRGEVMQRSIEEAAYITPDLLALPHVEKRRDGTSLRLQGTIVKTIEKAAVTMPWGAIPNYGHFVLDCLSGVAALQDITQRSGHQFVFPRLNDWQRRHLQLLDVQPLELDDTIYRISDLLFTSCVAHFLHAPNVNYLMARKRQLRNRAARGSSVAKLYISRPGRDNRVFLSEGRLVDKLRDLGFTVIVPETHSIDEQVDIFHRADVIVGCSGAGMANVLYCRPGANVVEIITPLTHGRWVSSVCAIVGSKWRPYFSDNITVGEPRVVGGIARPEAAFSFDVVVDDLLRFLDGLA